MKKNWWIVLAACSLIVLALSACAAKATQDVSETMKVPAEYAGKTNPMAGKADAAEAGKKVFTDNCESCHGTTGKGDGPAGASLDPKPADLTEVAANDPDDQIFWIVNEGGAAAKLSTSMAAWKGTLSEDEIWQVITYIRTLK
jgi:mono/diheme cytochrome c family protein